MYKRQKHPSKRVLCTEARNVVANSVHVTVQPLESSEITAIGASVEITDQLKEWSFFPAVLSICKQLWFGCTESAA